MCGSFARPQEPIIIGPQGHGGRGAAAKRQAFGAGVTACFSAGAAVPACRWSRSPSDAAARRPEAAKTAGYREDLTGIVVELIVWTCGESSGRTCERELRTVDNDTVGGDSCRAAVPLQRAALWDLPDRDAVAHELLRCSAIRQVPPHFFVRGFAGLALAPAAFTLAGVSPSLTVMRSHPGSPCRMRSAFFTGVTWP